jgi:chromosome segregation ATPase
MQRDLSLTNQERAAEAERYDELSVQVITLQRANAELEGRVLAGQEAEDALKQREAELDREVSMLRESLQQRVRDDMKRLEAEKESIDASQRALEEQRLAFEAKLVDRDLELARLRGEVVVTKELKATRSRELQAVRATADAFDAKVREAETVSQGLRNELDHARAEIGRLSSDQDALRDEVARKKAEIEALASVKATLLALVDGLDRLGADTRGLRTEAAAALEAVAEARQSARPPAKVSDAPKPAAADEDAPEVLAADIIEDDAGDRPTSVGEAPPEPPPAEAKADEAPPAEAKADSAKADEAKAADAQAADANADGGDKPWFEPKDADAAGDGATDSDWPSE